MRKNWRKAGVGAMVLAGFLVAWAAAADDPKGNAIDRAAAAASAAMVETGRQTFRFDTFGDETFWGGSLELHEALVHVTPRTALAVGLKVDADAVPPDVVNRISRGALNLDDPSVTATLLKLNAVVGVTGFFDRGGALTSVGIQCALCHSTVDQSFQAPGVPAGLIGHRLDGWANRDLNVGAIVALAPDLTAFSKVLGVDDATVRKVLNSWGPGKFDAELILDGKPFQPDGRSAATLLPPAFGLAGVNLHTWTGWGSVTYWNAFVANLEMHGVGRFFDARLKDANRFPLAAKNGFFDVNPNLDPDQDRITPKLAALHAYQLSLQAPASPFDSKINFAAKRGDGLFTGKAKCNSCHMEPLWTEPGWNMHAPAEVCVDDFQANRSPEGHYRTSPLGGLWTHQKGGFYHDGRFATLKDVVNHYNGCMSLGLSEDEKSDLIAYLLTL